MNIKLFLKNYQRDAKPHYTNFFRSWQEKAQKVGAIPQEIITRFIDMYPRGKQFRGALSVVGYELAGGKNRHDMLKASVAIELLETSILIADDVFDNDDLRRKIPTIHKQWEGKGHAGKGSSSRLYPESRPNKKKSTQSKNSTNDLPAKNLQAKYGFDMATITSILGLHLAPLVLIDTTFPEKNKLQALEFYCKSTIYTGFGEALDITSPFMDLEAKQNSAKSIHQYKTIWYSAILPLSFGAILAGSSQKKLQAIKQYAQCLGSVFQVQDDIIGSFGDPKITGKANTSDIKTTRWTILIEILFAKVSPKEKNTLKKMLLAKVITSKQINTIKQLMVKYHVIDLARKKAQTQIEQGNRVIPKITKEPEHQDTLKNILLFMLERQK